VKKDGRWQLLQAQGTRLAAERNPITVEPKLLDSLVGKYEFGPNAIATVTREGNAIRWRGGNRMPVTLVPLSETQFFAKRDRDGNDVRQKRKWTGDGRGVEVGFMSGLEGEED
jgi:hypothetical protein